MKIGTIAAWHQRDLGAIVELEKWERFYQHQGVEIIPMRGGGIEVPDGTRVLDELDPRNPSQVAFHREVLRSSPDPRSNDALFREVARRGLAAYKAIRTIIESERLDGLHVDALASYLISLPAAWAVAELAAEGVPMVLRSHDFTWERAYASNPFIESLIGRVLPPTGPSVLHVVSTESARRALAEHVPDANAIVAPNLFPVHSTAGRGHLFRQDFGVPADRLLLLQPTRFIPTKGIHHSVHLAHRLTVATGQPSEILVTGSAAGGTSWKPGVAQAYAEEVTRLAQALGVSIRMLDGKLRSYASDDGAAQGVRDAYAAADIVTYPSMAEGFGNPVVESALERRPLVTADFEVMLKEFTPLGYRPAAILRGDATSNISSDGWTFDIALDRIEDEMVQRTQEALSIKFAETANSNRELVVAEYGDSRANRNRYFEPAVSWFGPTGRS
ncbi:hypothetical protein [Curtobacterium sp. MEB011]|uniref:hypothetical protein n=1 Tax=Curtobacterium sp. MEB011 TaxID=3040285 RepID=UPI00254B6893|nr:hypothetical protein [Curtobacterium sp. MEB011]